MERVALAAKRRSDLGTGRVARLRRDGQIPGIVYGRGRDPVPVAVEAKALRAALHTQAGQNVLIDLAIANGDRGSQTVMVKELQRDIFVRNIIHVDFYTVDLAQKLEARVPITFIGQAAGIAEGGVFEVHLREIVVECLPTQIPEHIEVNVSELAIGDAIHVRALVVPSDVSVVTPPEEVVATVVLPKVVEEVTPAAATPEAAAAGEAPVGVPEAAAEAKPGEAKPAAPAAKPGEAKAAAPGTKPGDSKPAGAEKAGKPKPEASKGD